MHRDPVEGTQPRQDPNPSNTGTRISLCLHQAAALPWPRLSDLPRHIQYIVTEMTHASYWHIPSQNLSTTNLMLWSLMPIHSSFPREPHRGNSHHISPSEAGVHKGCSDSITQHRIGRLMSPCLEVRERAENVPDRANQAVASLRAQRAGQD